MAENETESALSVLKGQVNHLTSELQKASADRDKHQAARTHAETERDTLKPAAAGASEHVKRILELEGQLRTIRHQSAFSKAAKAAGVREEAVDHVFELSKYKAEKDEADPKAFDDILATAKESMAYAFMPPEADVTDDAASMSDRETVVPAPRVAAGAGRGGEASSAQKGAIVTAAQLADPKWALDPKNQAAKLDAAKNNRFRLNTR